MGGDALRLGRYLYSILDDVRLGKQMLLYAPLCTVIEEILEVVN